MCIIVAKNKQAKLPSLDTLKTCFENNPDGAGFMYVKHNKVVIDKGYMTLKSFTKHYNKLCRKYHNFNNKSLVIHFRIGTAGSNSQKNCHPYPVSGNISDLQKTYITTTLGVAHNGIISAYNPKGKNEHDINDTQNFICKFLSKLYQGYNGFYKENDILDGIEKLISSKMVLLNNKEELYFIGEHNFINDNGIMYSNSTYKKSSWTSWNNWNTTNSTYLKNYYDNSLNFKTSEKELLDTECESEYADYEEYENDYIKIKNGWFIEHCDGTLETNYIDNYYYNCYTGNVYYKDYTGNYKLKYQNVIVLNENYEEVY